MAAGYIMVTLEVAPEEGRWVSRCRELGTSMFGDTIEEALEAIREAVCMQLGALEAAGERQRFLEENGIVLHRTKPRGRSAMKQVSMTPGVLVERELVPV